MRLIDADALKADYGMKDDCADCDKELRGKSKACEFDRVYTKMDFCGWLDDARPWMLSRWCVGDGAEISVLSVESVNTILSRYCTMMMDHLALGTSALSVART